MRIYSKRIFKTVMAYMLIIAMSAGMAASLGGKAKAATISFVINANGGKINGQATMTTNYNGSTTITIPTALPVRSGYVFLGYGATTSSTNPVFYPGQSGVSVTKNTTIYAIWTKQKSSSNSVKIVNYNGHTRATVTQNVGTMLMNAYAMKKELPKGYYFGDRNGNKFSDAAPVVGNMTIYTWRCKDEITLRWNGTSQKLIVYTGDSLANSKDAQGSKYKLGKHFQPLAGNKQYIVGWKLNDGTNRTVSAGLPLICSGKSYTADVVTVVDTQTMAWQTVWVETPASELRIMYEATEEQYAKLAKKSGSTFKSIVSTLVFTQLGFSACTYVATASSVVGAISGIAGALRSGYYDKCKTELMDLHGNLECLVGTYRENKVYDVKIKYKTDPTYGLIPLEVTLYKDVTDKYY